MATAVLPETTRALYPFSSRFFTLDDGQRMHYVDEGPPDGEPLVFLHGYPMWSFAYRALIVYYAALGYRCVAMDHIGYGLSDKPTNRSYHTLRRHIHNVLEFVAALDLRQVTLIMEDWGTAFGLGYAVHHPQNIRRLVIMNSWVFQDTFEHRVPLLVRLLTWPAVGELALGVLNLAFPLGLQRWTARQLSAGVMMAYRSPFREARQRAALVQFPRMISLSPHHPSAEAMREIESGLTALHQVPALIVWGQEDPIFPPELANHWKKALPRARGPHFIAGARHFLSEDDPDGLALLLDTFLADTPAEPL
ncbi:MAG: alpha/beta fold hydrolase [Anaerolineae bacterium]|nr:alpha/beta fold hydrolase [Anaerolineae bacterium]